MVSCQKYIKTSCQKLTNSEIWWMKNGCWSSVVISTATTVEIIGTGGIVGVVVNVVLAGFGEVTGVNEAAGGDPAQVVGEADHFGIGGRLVAGGPMDTETEGGGVGVAF